MNLESMLFVVILIVGIAVPSYFEYMSPKKQIESGILPEDMMLK